MFYCIFPWWQKSVLSSHSQSKTRNYIPKCVLFGRWDRGHQPIFGWGGHGPALLHKYTFKSRVILLRSVAFHHCNNVKFDLLCPLCRTWQKCSAFSVDCFLSWRENTCITILCLRSYPPSLTPAWPKMWALLREATANGNYSSYHGGI